MPHTLAWSCRIYWLGQESRRMQPRLPLYAADGFSVGHPLADSSSNTGSAYAPFINGTYPCRHLLLRRFGRQSRKRLQWLG